MDFAPYWQAWRDRFEREQADRARAAVVARALAERLARLLARRFGARRVWLAGSLARGEFRRGSDIDLAAEGIAPDLIFAAGAAAAREAGAIDVDLVPLESADPAYLRDVAAEGVLLHDGRG